MNTYSFSIFLVAYAIFVLVLLDCDNACSRAARIKGKKASNQSSTASSKCPQDKVHVSEFQMKMALCRPNITVVCSAKPDKTCFKSRSKLKATAFVKRRNGQCLIESNVTAHRTLRFYVEARRVINPNEAGSRSLGGQEHQRGKCVLKYVCQKRFIRTITMECGTVFADEHGKLTNFTKQRQFWIAPPNFKDFVHFSAEMSVSRDKRVMNVASAKIFVPGMKQKENEKEKQENEKEKQENEKENQENEKENQENEKEDQENEKEDLKDEQEKK